MTTFNVACQVVKQSHSLKEVRLYARLYALRALRAGLGLVDMLESSKQTVDFKLTSWWFPPNTPWGSAFEEKKASTWMIFGTRSVLRSDDIHAACEISCVTG